ncbi:thiosulfate/3-mercaptopyruvate sulfurtransferase [Caloramator fervidus]|uniref:Sulfurtransferase n=1 Tax=Caloramator fervidus TaxID=29344 RepID=A0A1H5TAY5_9CLOT|nr:sulfurtransferase [Caloramator fervidus]SEF59147.1 thiosulfate/3-mercaptopyruvate sulfurtransferase [Caloramator fervidus]
MEKNNKILAIILAIILVLLGGYFGYRKMFGVQKVVVDSSEQGKKISQYANPDAFITPYQLKQLMDKKADVVVIGALDPKKGDPAIAGSFTVWRPDYSAKEGAYPFGGMRCSVEEMEALLSKFGATPKSTIVVYASNNHHDAARLWWQIKMLGHKDVRYLDGGLNAWIGAGYPTGNANPKVTPTNYKAPNPSEELLAKFDDVVAAMNKKDAVILDVRSEDEEKGRITEKGAFGPGKIAGAQWIEWKNALNEDTTLKSIDELKKIYGHLEGKEIITYCQSGVRSAHTFFVLTQALGYKNVKNYDGSWIEWSYEHYQKNNPSAKIENGK